MPDSNEVMLARYGERLTFIQEALVESKEDRKQLEAQVQKMFTLLSQVDNRVRLVEERLEEQAPILEEIVQLKHEIAGAKKVTRWLWAALTVMSGIVLSNKAALMEWFK